MGNPPLQSGNKVYTLKPKFITWLQNYFYIVKLKRYKKKKIKESKTPHQRYYHLRFKVRLDDIHNTQDGNLECDMLVPAQAAFFAKRLAEKDIKRKVVLDFLECEELSDEELAAYFETKEEYIKKQE